MAEKGKAGRAVSGIQNASRVRAWPLRSLCVYVCTVWWGYYCRQILNCLNQITVGNK